MTETARMREIKAELRRMEDRPHCCQPCDAIYDALFTRQEVLNAEMVAHEKRACQACTEAQDAEKAERSALLAEWETLTTIQEG